MEKEKLAKFLQFVKFGIVGVTNNVIFYLVNVAVLWLFRNTGKEWDYVVANIAGFFVSVLWSFYWNNKYVFKAGNGESRSWKTALLKTYAAYAFSGIVLNNALSYLWITVFGMSKYIAPLINLFITVPINFILNKLWAFKSSSVEEKKNDSSVG